MRSLLAISTVTFMLQVAAMAADPVGEWRVANGNANIRIDDCHGALWGVISWEKDPGGVDAHNPNPAERKRPTLGLHILMAMKLAKPGLWQGEVYNAENGTTYDSRMYLTAPDVLRMEGCVFGGLICGGENWTRVKLDAPAPAAAGRTPAAPPQSRNVKPGPASVLSACSGVADASGAPHKSGLK